MTGHRQTSDDNIRGIGAHRLWVAPPVWRVRGGPDPLLVQPPADLSCNASESEYAQLAPESCGILAASGDLGFEPSVRVVSAPPSEMAHS